ARPPMSSNPQRSSESRRPAQRESDRRCSVDVGWSCSCRYLEKRCPVDTALAKRRRPPRGKWCSAACNVGKTPHARRRESVTVEGSREEVVPGSLWGTRDISQKVDWRVQWLQDLSGLDTCGKAHREVFVTSTPRMIGQVPPL